jgi:hypothetical protein
MNKTHEKEKKSILSIAFSFAIESFKKKSHELI